jgi:hypothetical protein
VLIYKTYKDERTYMMNGQDIAWVRSLAGYRLGVILPKGFAFLSSDVAAQISTTADGRLKIVRESKRPEQPRHDSRAQDDGRSRRRHTRTCSRRHQDVSRSDAPETGRNSVTETYSDYRKGE